MRNRHNQLIIALAHEVELTIYKFLERNLKAEENTSDILDLILSSQLSSLATLMMQISSPAATTNPKIHDEVKRFITELFSAIHKIPVIKSYEFINP